MKNDLNDISSFEFIYTSKEVAEKVGIKTPTVRKYGQLLERYGYEFQKNGDRRNFVNADIITMKKMKKSNDIEKTAKMLAEMQKNDITDTANKPDKSDISVSPGDMDLISKEIQQELIKSEKRYNELMQFSQSMALEFATTKENVENILDELSEAKKREKEKDKIINDMNEKLQKAVDFIMELEKKEQIEPKKSIWQRLFDKR